MASYLFISFNTALLRTGLFDDAPDHFIIPNYVNIHYANIKSAYIYFYTNSYRFTTSMIVISKLPTKILATTKLSIRIPHKSAREYFLKLV